VPIVASVKIFAKVKFNYILSDDRYQYFTFVINQNQDIMSRRNKFLIKFLAILVVLVSVLLEIDVLNVSFLEPYKYWMSILGFGMLLIVSR